jgi:Domain of unknown function (DUF4124)
MTKFRLFVVLIASTAFSLPASAKLYKWVDDNGTTHYGEAIPPEYADKDRQEIKGGRVVNTEEVLTPERRRAKEEEEAKNREKERAELEQKRYDNTLISTYSSTKEIDLARDRSLKQIDLRINAINFSVKMASDNLDRLQNEADRYSKKNKEIPKSLTEDLRDAQTRLDKLKKDLEIPVSEKTALEARYDADKARYIELTGRK